MKNTVKILIALAAAAAIAAVVIKALGSREKYYPVSRKTVEV